MSEQRTPWADAPIRLLVCGGRDFTDWILFQSSLKEYRYKTSIVIHGGAIGADTLANHWAVSFNTPIKVYKPNWSKYGVKAGPIRNKQMLDKGKPNLVIAFPTPKSRGTYDMIRQAEKAGVEVIIIK